MSDIGGTTQFSKKQFYLDLLERTAWTAAQSFLGVLVGIQTFGGATEAEIPFELTLRAAGIAALIAVAKCLLGTQIGSNNSAAWLPTHLDPPGRTPPGA